MQSRYKTAQELSSAGGVFSLGTECKYCKLGIILRELSVNMNKICQKYYGRKLKTDAKRQGSTKERTTEKKIGVLLGNKVQTLSNNVAARLFYFSCLPGN